MTKLSVDTRNTNIYIQSEKSRFPKNKMIKSFARKITKKLFISYARLTDHGEIIDVCEHLSRIATALVMMPERREHFSPAVDLLFRLREQFPQTTFYLLVNEALLKEQASHLVEDERLLMIFCNEDHLGFGGLPKDALQEAIRSRHFDLLIDLNDDFNFTAAYLCRSSNAKLRVCLQHPHRDPFYNFQVRAHADESLDHKYQTLMKYICVFLPISGAPPANLVTA